MSKRSFKVYDNYLDFMRVNVSFNGLSNRRKSLILWALFHSKGLTARQLYWTIGDCSYGALRFSIHRLLLKKHIGVLVYSPSAWVYSIRVKGCRFLYASSHLAPLKEWISAAQQKVNQRNRFMAIKNNAKRY